MAKELPYFQFEPAEYLTKDISFCSLQAQGLFMNICAYYWQRNCEITQEQILRRLNYPVEFKELLDEGIIDIENDKIIIKFLNSQMLNATKTSEKNSANGSLGGAKVGNQNASKKEKQPKNEPKTTQKQGIREDKIKEDEIIEDKIIGNKIKKENTCEVLNEIFEEEFTNLLAEYFLQTTEVQKMRITGFLMSKDIKPQIENFKEQTIAYAKYKKLTGEKIHNWNSYQTEWDREDWIKKLKRETNGKQFNNITGADQEFRDKTAKRLGIIQS